MNSGKVISKLSKGSTEPLRDQILQKCRIMLMSGHVEPGQKLSLRPLAQEFDTSLMPVRDALNRLVADGALELSSSRTIRVPMMDDDRLVELHEIRKALECLAAGAATPKITNTSVARLEELISEMAHSLAKEDYDTYVSNHFSFHFTIYTSAGMPNLLSMIDVLWLQIGPWFRQGIERANPILGNPNEGHEKVVAALKSRDVKGVQRAIEADVSEGARWYKNGAWFTPE